MFPAAFACCLRLFTSKPLSDIYYWRRAVYGELTASPWQPEPGSELYNNFNDINVRRCCGCSACFGMRGGIVVWVRLQSDCSQA